MQTLVAVEVILRVRRARLATSRRVLRTTTGTVTSLPSLAVYLRVRRRNNVREVGLTLLPVAQTRVRESSHGLLLAGCWHMDTHFDVFNRPETASRTPFLQCSSN